MGAALKKTDDSFKTQTNVFDFLTFKNTGNTTQEQITSDDIIEKIISSPDFEDYLQQLIEGSVYTYLAENISTDMNKIEDPFDAIYIADLKPDQVKLSNDNLLLNLSGKILDKSDEIFIDDGLDD
jgi:hypothetical protein